MHLSGIHKRGALAALLLLIAGACTGQVPSTEVLASADDGDVQTTQAALLTGEPTLHSMVKVTIDRTLSPLPVGVPMYTTSTSTVVGRMLADQMAAKIVIVKPENNRYRVEVGSPAQWGWVDANRLTLHHVPQTIAADRNPTARLDALIRARPAMGMSYWWGHAKWPVDGPTILPADNHGKCTKTKPTGCPDCTHAATSDVEYGGDCSGFLSTMWLFPDGDPTNDRGTGAYAASAYCKDKNSAGTAYPWKTLVGGTPATAAYGFSLAIAGDGGTKNVTPSDGTASCSHVWLVAAPRDTTTKYIKTYECRGCDEGCMMHERKILDGNGVWHMIRKNGW